MNIEAFEKELKKLFEKKYPKEKLDLIEDWFFVGYVSFYRDKRLKIEDKISKLLLSEIVSEIIIDPKILGGFIAETEKYHIDGSIQGNLIRLKNLIEQD